MYLVTVYTNVKNNIFDNSKQSTTKDVLKKISMLFKLMIIIDTILNLQQVSLKTNLYQILTFLCESTEPQRPLFVKYNKTCLYEQGGLLSHYTCIFDINLAIDLTNIFYRPLWL